MIAKILSEEQTLGRSIAPRRIIAARYLQAGARVPVLRRDGTHVVVGDGADRAPYFLGPVDQSGWLIEAEGTFLDANVPSVIGGLASHAYYFCPDTPDGCGAAARVMIPCWVRGGAPAERMEGICPPP